MCDFYAIPYSTFLARIHRQGKVLKDALTEKIGNSVEDHLGTTFNTIKEMCDFYGIKEATYLRRIKSGYSKEDALTIGVGGIQRKSTGNQPHTEITIDDIKYNSISEAAEAFGLKPSTVIERLRRGWTPEESLKEELNKRVNTLEAYDHLGNKFISAAEMCSFYNKSYSLVKKRLYKGWTVEEALTIPKNMYIGEYRVAECLKRLNIKFFHNCTIKKVFTNLNINIDWKEFLSELQNNISKVGYNWSKQKIARLRPDFVLYTDDESRIKGVIEFDGEQHQTFIEYFFKTIENFYKRIGIDFIKQSLWEYKGIPMLRIRHDQIDKIDDMVKDFIDHPKKYIHNHNTYLSEEEYWSILKEQKLQLDLAFAG